MAKIVKMTREGRAGAIEDILRELFPDVDERTEKRVFDRLADAGIISRTSSRKRKADGYDKEHPSLCDMTQPSSQYVLALTIENCPVRVYRQMEVMSNIRLEHLAHVIMRAVGWEYMGEEHKFTKRNATYVPPSVLEGDNFRWLDNEDAMAVTLGEVLLKKGDTMRFKYNYDEWSVKIRLSSVKPLSAPTIRIIKGVGDSPLSFGNGAEDYAELLKGHYPAIDDELEEHYGEPFDPDEFALEYCQKKIDQYVNGIRQTGR